MRESMMDARKTLCTLTKTMLFFVLLFLAPVAGDLIEGRKPYYIMEELPANTLIGNVAIDAGLTTKYDETVQRQLSYTFLQPGGTVDEKFHLFEIDNRSSIIKTTQQIDRDKVCANEVTCYVRFDVAVGPAKYFEVIKIIVDIVDVNDHSPEFVEDSVFLKVSESVEPGTRFQLPTAVDPDCAAYSVQSYEIIAHKSKFDLVTETHPDGSQDLQLVVKGLDREEANFYQFQVVAYDGGDPQKSGSILVNIEVEDSNDNDPTFENATYEVFVLENVDPGTTIARVQAHDLDSGTNGKVTYAFSARTINNFGHLFGINNATGTIYLKEALDFEQGSTYQLVVYANDHGPNSTPAHASVIVRVEDSNDNPPEVIITPTNRIAHVAESASIGTLVAHVSVMDQDGGDNGKVGCSLNQAKFNLRKKTENQFEILTAAALDKEHEPQYKIQVSCFDLGFRPRTSTVDITVRVLDDNDHVPMFPKNVYHAFIAENNYLNQEIIKLNATDSDHGVNGEVRYRLEPNERVVKINPLTGSIQAAAVFDREQMEEYHFTVVAYDQGVPSLSSTVSVILTITDQNDEAPKFTQSSYALGTFEHKPVNTKVGEVVAQDKDTAPNAKFKYYFNFPSSNATKSFRIDEDTGEIYTTRNLDRETQPVYYMKVEARSEDYPRMSGTASVTIYVADTNDNAPVIQWPNVHNNTVFISNLVQEGYEIARVEASDRDVGSNAKLQYHITGGNHHHRFAVNPALGVITTAHDISDIAFEVFALTLTVEDNGYPQLSASVVLNIVVNQSIPHTPAKRVVYTNNNVTIIISLTSASLILVFLLVIAILLVRRQSSDRKQQASTEAQKMLHGRQLQRDRAPAPDWPGHKEHNTVQVDMPPDTAVASHSKSLQTPVSTQHFDPHEHKIAIEAVCYPPCKVLNTAGYHDDPPPAYSMQYSKGAL